MKKIMHLRTLIGLIAVLSVMAIAVPPASAAPAKAGHAAGRAVSRTKQSQRKYTAYVYKYNPKTHQWKLVRKVKRVPPKVGARTTSVNAAALLADERSSQVSELNALNPEFSFSPRYICSVALLVFGCSGNAIKPFDDELPSDVREIAHVASMLGIDDAKEVTEGLAGRVGEYVGVAFARTESALSSPLAAAGSATVDFAEDVGGDVSEVFYDIPFVG